MTKHCTNYSKARIGKRFSLWSSGHLVIWSSLLLTACGFSPMYAQKNQAPLSVGVLIEASKDEMGQQFQQNLEDQLNSGVAPANPAYKLVVSLGSAAGGMGVARDGTVSRYNVTLTSVYTLIRLADKKVIQQDTINHVSSFNNPANQYFSTYISQKDAQRRGIMELSELYRQRIGALLLREKAP
jgi:LPS-assembly lipoprotein